MGTSVVGGEPLVEKHVIKFKTGKAPDYIPPGNVAYSYPLANQYNFYKNESSEGYIHLRQGQEYLFNNTAEWTTVARFQSRSGLMTDVPLNYVSDAKELRFVLPQNLDNDQIIECNVVNLPRTGATKIDANVSERTLKVTENPGQNVDVRTRTAEGTIKETQEKKLYGTFFRTSKYNTFRDKIGSVNPSSGWRYPIDPGVHLIGSNIGGPEPFSTEEITGSHGTAPLVQIGADLSNVAWYNDKVFPIIYEGYPIDGAIRILTRQPEVLGVVPVKGVYLYQYPYQVSLSASDLESGRVVMPSWVGRFDYSLALHMYGDYKDLSNQAANYVVRNGGNARLSRLVNSTFPVIQGGDYWINIHYRLPGRNTITSTYRHKIHNPID